MTPVAARAIARVRWRLVPFLALLYLVAYLDRVNVGFAALQMNASLGFSGSVYGLGAGIFFIGYFLFEVPSNLILARVGARVWIARIAHRLGDRLDCDDVRPRAVELLRAAISPGGRGGGLFSRESSTTSRCGFPRASGRARSRSSRLPASPLASLAGRFLVHSCRWAGSRTLKAGSGCFSSRGFPLSSSAW